MCKQEDYIKDKVRELNLEIKKVELLGYCISTGLIADRAEGDKKREALLELARKNNLQDRFLKHIRKLICDAHGFNYWEL